MNYFNYFTEAEEHFQRARGTSLFLLSPLDWALLESWKNSGVPLDAVCKGIDEAFEKWRVRRVKTQNVNSLAFCAQAVLTAAQRSPEAAAASTAEPPFSNDEIRLYLAENSRLLRETGLPDIAASLDKLHPGPFEDLEDLERQLTVLEQKMIALKVASLSDEDSLAHRRDLDAQLRPYRGKMTADQIQMLEKQFLERKILSANSLPRLSLFYLK